MAQHGDAWVGDIGWTVQLCSHIVPTKGLDI